MQMTLSNESSVLCLVTGMIGCDMSGEYVKELGAIRCHM